MGERTPEARGPFDILAVRELESAMAARIETIEAEVQSLAPTESEIAAACRSAQATRDGAAAELREAADVFCASQKEQQGSEVFLAEARKTVREAGNALRKVEGSLERANTKLSKLQEGALHAFGELRDRTRLETVVGGMPAEMDCVAKV